MQNSNGSPGNSQKNKPKHCKRRQTEREAHIIEFEFIDCYLLGGGPKMKQTTGKLSPQALGARLYRCESKPSQAWLRLPSTHVHLLMFKQLWAVAYTK